MRLFGRPNIYQQQLSKEYLTIYEMQIARSPKKRNACIQCKRKTYVFRYLVLYRWASRSVCFEASQFLIQGQVFQTISILSHGAIIFYCLTVKMVALRASETPELDSQRRRITTSQKTQTFSNISARISKLTKLKLFRSSWLYSDTDGQTQNKHSTVF